MVPAAPAAWLGWAFVAAAAAIGQERPDAAHTGWLSARPDYAWSFPRDHWSHPGYKTEWWYFTGQLEAGDPPGRRFGYQVTFFRVGVLPHRSALASDWATSNLVMGHLAVTDVAAGRHVFSELLYRTMPLLGGFGTPGDTLIVWSRAPAGTDARWTLRWTGDGFELAARDAARGIALALTAIPAKPLILQGPNGYSRKGDGPTAASLYYSYTRLETSGTLAIGTERFTVRGESWMDREFGSNQLGEDQVGWDWFSLQLEDGRELMLYALRDTSGAAGFASGTLIGPEGEVAYLERGAWTAEVTDRWRSRSTGTVYPAGWTITIPAHGVRLRVRPLVPEQENVSALVSGLHYWEGAVAVEDMTGRLAGRGYVELTGYGKGRRVAI